MRLQKIIPFLLLLLLVIPGFIGVCIDTTTHAATDELMQEIMFYSLSPQPGEQQKNEQLIQETISVCSQKTCEQPQPTVTPTGSARDPAYPLLLSHQWPMQCFDIRHTGRSIYSTASNPGIEKWRYHSSGGIDDGIAIDDEGIIYFGSKDRYMYALYPNGTRHWRYLTNGWITSSPALTDDGTIYVGSWDCYIYAFDLNGTLLWRYGTGGTIASSPVFDTNGIIYFGTMRGSGYGDIFAVYPNGTLKWKYETGYYITSDPAIGLDGTIYIGSGDTYLYAMNPNGTLKWRFKTNDIIQGSPSIADDGTVYIGSFDDYLYALYPTNGTMKWKCKVGVGTETNPSLGADGTIYVGSDRLYAVYPNGTMRWAFNPGYRHFIAESSPAISADGTIYFGTNVDSVGGGEIIAVNPNGTEKWRKGVVGSGWVDSSPSIAADGTVYIGSTSDTGGYLHAFGTTETTGPPTDPTITGTQNGEIGRQYWYSFTSIDPDNHPVRYFIDWGDGETEWSRERASGETCWEDHKWMEQNTYTIRAKAQCTVSGLESDWVTLEVTMPKNKAIYVNHPILNWLWERFPNLFPVLRYISIA